MNTSSPTDAQGGVPAHLESLPQLAAIWPRLPGSHRERGGGRAMAERPSP